MDNKINVYDVRDYSMLCNCIVRSCLLWDFVFYVLFMLKQNVFVIIFIKSFQQL